MAITHDQLWGRLAIVDANVKALLAYLPGIIQQINSIGGHMSELDQSVDALRQAVTDLGTRIGELPQQLADALTRIGELNTQITELQADDAADDAQIAALTEERDSVLADAQENVTEIQEVTDQVQALGQGQQDTPA